MANELVKGLLAENNWQVSKDDNHNGYARDVLVRFIQGIPKDGISSCVEYLRVSTSVKNVDTVINTVVDPITTPEGKWTGTYYGGRIWYEKMQEPSKGQEGSFNLYQALHKGGTELNVITDNGCRWKVTQDWFYKQPTMGTVPASTSGINYNITNVSLDEEFGVYTYCIEKREHITQEIPLYSSTYEADELLKRRQILGVRTGDKDDIGTAITLPGLATFVDGVINSIQRSKNEDCTQDIEVGERDAQYQHVELKYVSYEGDNWFAWGHNGTETQFRAAMVVIGGTVDSGTGVVTFTGLFSYRIHKELNKFNLYDWMVMKHATTIHVPDPVGEAHETGTFYVIQREKIWGKASGSDTKREAYCYRTLTYHYDLSWFGTYSQAMNGINGGISPFSHVRPSSGLFGAYKVTHNPTSDVTGWTLDET